MAMAHGSNSNAIYLLFTSNFNRTDKFPLAIKIACAHLMGFGVYISGSKMIKEVGTKLVTDANSCAFVAQFTAMVTTLISSVIGYPVATSQAYFFSLYGLKKFHNNPEIITMDKKLMNWMIVLWLVLPFTCIAITLGLGGVYFLLKNFISYYNT